MTTSLRRLVFFQGGYYLVTGVWPLLAPSSFQFVTGPKHDLWLAQTVGLLLAIAGFVLVRAASRRSLSSELALLATLHAAALAIIDLACLRNERTTWAYLADVPLQLACIAAWWRLYWHRSGR